MYSIEQICKCFTHAKLNSVLDDIFITAFSHTLDNAAGELNRRSHIFLLFLDVKGDSMVRWKYA